MITVQVSYVSTCIICTGTKSTASPYSSLNKTVTSTSSPDQQ